MSALKPECTEIRLGRDEDLRPRTRLTPGDDYKSLFVKLGKPKATPVTIRHSSQRQQPVLTLAVRRKSQLTARVHCGRGLVGECERSLPRVSSAYRSRVRTAGPSHTKAESDLPPLSDAQLARRSPLTNHIVSGLFASG